MLFGRMNEFWILIKLQISFKIEKIIPGLTISLSAY
jgi:hypothetical protein